MKPTHTRIVTVSEEIPDIVIGRLPVYLRALTNMAESGHKLTTSSHELGERREWPVAVIGAGYIGHALASYNGFKHRGFRIAWIFDNDPQKIGTKIGDLTVQPIDEMVDTLNREKTQVVILAVPAPVAQQTADAVAQTYVRSILNYAPVHLNVPAHIHVRHNDPVIQMQRMTFYLDPDLS
ncbi:MAG: redox-sensing transcriptional repressor Rex [Chloroflexi bacterium]|nr:redox-sensing transcriptional repressor Rex [Chloroflexota bacterium]